MVTDVILKELIHKASNARANAFVPRSDHKIGAVILSTDGYIFAGCNIESNISGLGTCAERGAIDAAIAQGKYEYEALLVLDSSLTYPCGACLQYLFEFYSITGNDISIILIDDVENKEATSLLSLLPHGYIPHHDLKKIKKYRNKIS